MNRIVLVVAGLGLVGLIVVRQFLGSEPLSPKAALDSSIEQVKGQRALSPEEETRLRVEIAWGDYMVRNGKPPTSINDLVPTYFDTVPKDPTTGEPFNYPSTDTPTKAQPTEVASLASASDIETVFSAGGVVNPNTMRESEFVYDPTGKRDPFLPFDFSKQNAVDTSLPPLERYSLGQLKVTAILRDTKDGDFYAFVEDATGIGYPVRKGTRIGDAEGLVVRITEDSLFIVETRTDFTGKSTRSTVEMKLQRAPGTDKNSAFQRVRNQPASQGGQPQRR